MINKLLLNFKNNKNDISLFLEIVKYYRFNNNFIEAEKFVNENGSFKNDDRVQFELANIYICMGKKEQAIEIFENLIKNGSKNLNIADIVLELIKLYKEKREYEKAIEIINVVLESCPNDDKINKIKFELASIYICMGKKEQAIEIFEDLIKTEDVNILDITLNLIKLYKEKQEYEKAIEVIDIALKSESKNEELYLQKIIFQRFIPDGKSAIDTVKQFKENIENINSNKLIKNIENVERTRRQIAPYRCFFTWGMHYKCNYRCAYCYAPKSQEITFENNPNNVARYEKLETIVDSWKYIYDKYGSSRIRLDGGEPSIYPNFFEIIKELSKIHRLQMNTNLSFDVNRFCDVSNPETIRVDASLHCEYTKLETFVEKLKLLKQKGYKLTVSYVGYPDFLENIPLAKKVIEQMNIPFFIHPYSGFYEGKQYPQSYTEQDKKFIYDVDCESKTELVWRQERKSKYKDKENTDKDRKWSKEEIEIFQKEKQKIFEEKIKSGKYKRCAMGQMYARIYPNGNVYRCCSSDGNTYLGNLFDRDTTLLEKPEKCYDIDNCRCWRCMIPGEEPRWLHTWLDDWETEI